MKHSVVIGLLGSKLDAGFSAIRWNRWRPSVAACQQEDLIVNEYHLVYNETEAKLADTVIKDIAHVSPQTNVVRKVYHLSNPWNFEEMFSLLMDIIHTIPFDPEESEYLVNITTGTHVAQICLFLLAAHRRIPGKLLQMVPPKKNEKTQHVGTHVIIDLDLSQYDWLSGRRKHTDDDIAFLKSGIKTKNKAFNKLIEQVEHVAVNSTEPILLTGPTGAGKSLLANRIFSLKKNRGQVHGRFVEVNCATIRGDAAMSALFGHRKGSFTGALNDRTGLLKSADWGMVFLDEVGELGIDEQAMLLRAVEEKKFMPFGADQEIQSDFQLICGTNKNLENEVRAGRFREDLLARINMWTFELPGLKDRREDIEPNIQFELERFAEKKGKRVAFKKEAWEAFLSFATAQDSYWWANFRDLNGAITRMCTLAPGGRITTAVQREETERLRSRWQWHEDKLKEFPFPATTGGLEDNLEDNSPLLQSLLGKEKLQEIDLFDRVQLAEVVKVCLQCRTLSDAGRKLFEVSRLKKKNQNDSDRLKKYLERFALTWEDIQVLH